MNKLNTNLLETFAIFTYKLTYIMTDKSAATGFFDNMKTT